MNKNVKIAKELIKLAKSLVAKQNIANKEGRYEDFTGTIDWKGTKGKVEDATFELTNDVKCLVLWEGGNWLNGYWKSGHWEWGFFTEGTWQDGIWQDGVWIGYGVWKNGTWENGNFNGGIWENGTWENGSFAGKIWKNGIFKAGIFSGAIWMNGVWEDGWWYSGKDEDHNKHEKNDSPDKWEKEN